MVERIENITLYVNDQEESKKFWTKKIGFIIIDEHNLGPNSKWIEVGPRGEDVTSFVLYDKHQVSAKNPTIDLSHPSLLLKASNIERTYLDLKENGVVVGEFMDMPSGKMFTFKDPDGNSYIMREDKKSLQKEML